MFSPFYKWSRSRGAGEPLDHCSLNVALYGRPRRWAMTERGRRAVYRDATQLRIGPSLVRWDGASLAIDIDEVTAPLPSRIRGTVRVHPAALTGQIFPLDGAGHHHWSPIAPACRVEVALGSPALTWSGPGYLDSNWGARPLEADFVHWDWCRAPMPDAAGRPGAAILYNAIRREGGEQSLALRVEGDGAASAFPPPPRIRLAPTFWRMTRDTRVDAGHTATVRQTLEDAPFYSRSVIDTHLLGQPVTAVHESLSMDRFINPLVQAMLPMRIPRQW